MFRKPSEFRRISILMAKREAEEDLDEIPLSSVLSPRETKSRIKLKRKTRKIEISFDQAKSITEPKEPGVRPSIDQNKNDILSYLDKLISGVEWLVIGNLLQLIGGLHFSYLWIFITRNI